MDNPFQSLHVLVVHPNRRVRARILKLLKKQGVGNMLEAEDGDEAAAEIARQPHAMEIAIFDPMQTDSAGTGLIDLIASSARVRSALLLMDDSNAEAELAEVLTQRKMGFLGILEGRFSPNALNQALLEYFRHSQSSDARARQEVEGQERSLEEIQTGLAERQFTAFFQPEIDVRHRQFSGFEALARWQHPIHGLIPPLEFIPAMERGGLIEPLTDIVFQRSLQVLAKWREQGHDLRLSVNFSPLSLANPRTPERLLRQVDRMRLPAICVAVEISESAVLSAAIVDTLRLIRGSGLRVTLDNYSGEKLSIENCKEIGCSGIKLPRSLISGIDQQQSSQERVGKIAEAARDAGIALNAEGVENEAEWHALEALGCEGLQGFMLGKPVDASQLNGWYALYRDRIPVKAA